MKINKITSVFVLVSTVFSVSAMAGGLRGASWGGWVASVNTTPIVQNYVKTSTSLRTYTPAVSYVPAGTANYSGSTVALISDSSTGTVVNSVSTGAVNLAVTFSGTGATTETGTITGLTGSSGAKVGDLAFTASGLNGNFNGAVTSTIYPAVAATTTTTALGTGTISGALSQPVVVTPAVAATSTTPAVAAVVSAPTSVQGSWAFTATSTLTARGTLVGVKQ